MAMEENLKDAEARMQVLSRAETRIEESMKIFDEGLADEICPVRFFMAWAISPAVIAERLRRSGFETTAEEIQMIMTHGIRTKLDDYLLKVTMMEMKNNINKTLYK